MEHVQSRLSFIPPRFNPWVWRLTRFLLPVVLRWRTRPWLPAGITHIETHHVERLVDLYHKFQTGHIRLLIAFRHPEVDDPLSMFHLLSRVVPRVARQKGIPLKAPVHSHFMYERGMLLWAGDWLGWYFSRLGGTSIRRGKHLDRIGLRHARELLLNGKMPLSIAPEGATNGHSEIVSPLEPGVAQLGFWCVEDLKRANRSESVYIVPIGLQYRYVSPPWTRLEALLSQLERDSGLLANTKESEESGKLGGRSPIPPIVSPTNNNPTTNTSDPNILATEPSPEPAKTLYLRFLHLAAHLLDQLETFYRQFYHQTIPIPSAVCDGTHSEETSPSFNTERALETRLKNLLQIALNVSEDYFKLSPDGTIIDRCRRVEEAGWSYIYREDLADAKHLSPLQQGLADWIAEEASLRMRHMRMVESFVAVTGSYLQEKPSAERFGETLLICFDVIARIKGQKFPKRPRLGWRSPCLTVGEPISITDYAKRYGGDRLSIKQAVKDLTQDLQQALEKMIQ